MNNYKTLMLRAYSRNQQLGNLPRPVAPNEEFYGWFYSSNGDPMAYIDDYGNATLNITYKEFERIRAERPFEMLIRENSLTEVVPNYSFAKKAGNGRGALLLTVSATGHLQLAMRLYSAQQYFGLREQDSITVLFPTIQPPITP